MWGEGGARCARGPVEKLNSQDDKLFTIPTKLLFLGWRGGVLWRFELKVQAAAKVRPRPSPPPVHTATERQPWDFSITYTDCKKGSGHLD